MMSTCGVSQLYSSSCPRSCPFWAPSVIWRSVGVCTTEDDCITYNPTLGFADHKRKMCLPCKIFGCVKCIQSSVSSCSKRDSDAPPRNNYSVNFNWFTLSDTTFGSPLDSREGECDQYCLECAKGFNRSEDGKMCYLVSSRVWTISLFITSIAIFLVAAILSIRVILNPKRLEVNLETLRMGIEQRESSLLHQPSTESLYDIWTDLTSTNVSGLGLMLYFRFLTFLIFVILILLTANITHSPLACSKMIRVFGEGYDGKNDPSTLGTPNSSMLSLFINDSPLPSAEEPLLDLKTVDEVIAWNALEYARGMVDNNLIIYFVLTALTLVYIMSQRKFIQTQANNLQLKNFTLLFKNLYNTTEDGLKDLILKINGVEPHSITQCYNFRQHTKLVHEILEITKNKDHYVRFCRSLYSIEEEMYHFTFSDNSTIHLWPEIGCKTRIIGHFALFALLIIHNSIGQY